MTMRKRLSWSAHFEYTHYQQCSQMSTEKNTIVTLTDHFNIGRTLYLLFHALFFIITSLILIIVFACQGVIEFNHSRSLFAMNCITAILIIAAIVHEWNIAEPWSIVLDGVINKVTKYDTQV